MRIPSSDKNLFEVNRKVVLLESDMNVDGFL